MQYTASEPSDMEGLCVDNVRASINTIPDINYLATTLARWNPKHDSNGRFTSGSGSLKNLKVSVGLDRVMIAGSPARYCHTANAFPFGPAEMGEFVRQIASGLHVPEADVMNGTTSTIDVALNLVTAHSPRAYYPLLLDMPRTRRVEEENTLYFRNATRKARLYDKVLEVRSKGLAEYLSDEQLAANVLRIEFSTRTAARDFGAPVTLGDLADPAFWPKVQGFWMSHFYSIKQIGGSTLSDRAGILPTTAASLRDYYAAFGIQATGGKEEAMAAVRARQSAGEVSPDQASRMRKMIAALDDAGSFAELRELAVELDNGVVRVLEQFATRVQSGHGGRGGQGHTCSHQGARVSAETRSALEEAETDGG